MAMSVKLPPDDVGATLQRRDGVRGQRYGEIFLIGTDTATGRLVGSVYNTTGLNDPTGAGDSCPQGLWDRVDAQVVAKEYAALGAVKNGPPAVVSGLGRGDAAPSATLQGSRRTGACGLMSPTR